MTFSVGDRVLAIQDIHKGKTGTIIGHSECKGQFHVEFDGRTPDMKGFEGKYWFWPSEINKIMI